MSVTDERSIREELHNICENYPLFPGKTISHQSAGECVRRGWAERNRRGDFLPTALGLRENDAEQEAVA